MHPLQEYLLGNSILGFEKKKDLFYKITFHIPRKKLHYNIKCSAMSYFNIHTKLAMTKKFSEHIGCNRNFSSCNQAHQLRTY